MRHIVTGDETWIHHHDPETKQQSMQWKRQFSKSPQVQSEDISWQDNVNSFLGRYWYTADSLNAT